MQQSQRPQWVDYAKGIGILLVVFAHILRGIKAAQLSLSDQLFLPVYDGFESTTRSVAEIK